MVWMGLYPDCPTHEWRKFEIPGSTVYYYHCHLCGKIDDADNHEGPPTQRTGTKKISTGPMTCQKCLKVYPDAAPSEPNGSLICWECKNVE
jgi:hypothetical protein